MTSLAEDHVDVPTAAGQVVQRLVDAYGTRRTRDQIVAAVTAAQHDLAGARIEAFLPILVERIARERLEDSLRSGRSALSGPIAVASDGVEALRKGDRT